MVRLHLDEDQPNALATALARHGFDITTSPQMSLRGATDPDQVQFALEQNRVIITSDTDFLRLDAAGVTHAGIIYYSQRKRQIGHLVPRIAAVARRLTPQLAANHVEFV